jgi:hypothetical protein
VLIKLFKKIQKQKYYHSLVLIIIFSLAAYLRFTHLNWDQGLALHPDERNIAAAVTRLNWPTTTDPEFYVYNGLPLFLADISSQIISCLTNNIRWQTDYGKINLITRSYSALFSLLSVLFFYLIAQKIFKKKISLLLTFLASTTVALIQHAHFGVTESLLLLELLILSWLSIRLIKEKSQWLLLAMAIILGNSLATKSSALAFAIIPIVVILMIYPLSLKTIFKLIIFFSITTLVFYILSPHTFYHFQQFLLTMRYEQAIASGQQQIFYTMQFIDTKPYLFQIKTLVWQSSLPLLLTAGWGFCLFLKNRQKYRVLWPFMLFSVLYFLYVGTWHAKFNRYLIPVIPALILLTGLTLDQFKNHRLKKILIVILLLTHALWAWAFMHIYQTEHIRITASRWIENNVSEQSVILHEERDERLPVILNKTINYQYLLLELYQVDNLEKIYKLSEQLSKGDYLIIASQRLYHPISKSNKHPYTNNYYQLLFAEQLGYQKIVEFSSDPNLFGIKIKDDGVEETFKVFDHPTIYIFKNIDRLAKEALYKKIMQNN